MNPVIVHPKENPDNAFLIDLHAVALVRVEGAGIPQGHLSSLALKGIAIKNLTAGQFAPIDGQIYPMPCQLAACSDYAIQPLLWRGIYPDAANALLGMPLGFDCSIEPGKDFTFRHGGTFNKWHFATAWGWSLWQELHRRSGHRDWPLERRWKELQNIGFPAGFGAFRQICSRLKLSVTESRPNL